MCWTIFLAGKQLYFGYDFTAPTNSKYFSINCRLAVMLRESFEFPNFRGQESVRGFGFLPIESSRTTSQYISIQTLVYLLPFGRNSNVKYWPPISTPPPRLGDQDGPRGSKMVSFEILIRRLYKLWAYPAPFGHSIQRGRQTDRTMAIGHLRYSIGGLIKAG